MRALSHTLGGEVGLEDDVQEEIEVDHAQALELEHGSPAVPGQSHGESAQWLKSPGCPQAE